MNAYKREFYRKHIRELERISKRDPILTESNNICLGLLKQIIEYSKV